MKEGGGGDHVSVGVKLPRSRGIRPISKKNLYRQRPGRKLLLLLLLLLLFSSGGGVYQCCFSVIVAALVSLVLLLFALLFRFSVLLQLRCHSWSCFRLRLWK